jgi:UDP-N-acetylglucosamine acyltransferase
LNLRGLKRRQFSDVQIHNLRRAYKLLYKSELRLDEAQAQLDVLSREQPEVAVLADFIRSSERGLIR